MRFSDESKASTHSHFRELHQWDVLTNRVHQDATHFDEGCKGRIPVHRRLHVDQASPELSAKAWEVLADPSCPLRRPTKRDRTLRKLGPICAFLPKSPELGVDRRWIWDHSLSRERHAACKLSLSSLFSFLNDLDP